MIEGLCSEHEFTVFAVEFDNPCPDRVTWVRIPVPTRPLALLFVAYHLVAPVVFFAHKMRHGARYDIVQRVENYLGFGDVAYVQFCHRAFLSQIWPAIGGRGFRNRVRWLDHFLRAMLEPIVYRRTARFVVPSTGLEEELKGEFDLVASRIVRVPNPVEVRQFVPPADFDREAVRRDHGFSIDDIVLVFTALGHFERKGLPLVLAALQHLPDYVKLMVVGGDEDLVRAYARRAMRLGVGKRTAFVGMVDDVSPYLLSADAFIFPSFYETFSLSVHEAAAAGLPVIATRVHGVTDSFRDGENALLVESTVESVRTGIDRFISLSTLERAELGTRGRDTVQQFDPSQFADRWREFYRGVAEFVPPR